MNEQKQRTPGVPNSVRGLLFPLVRGRQNLPLIRARQNTTNNYCYHLSILKQVFIFPDEIHWRATPGMAVTVNEVRIIGRKKVVFRIIHFPESIRSLIYHASP